MKTNSQLDEILKLTCDGKLGKALSALENFLLTYSYPKEQERLSQIQEDYHRMVDYWQRGFKDDRRDVVFLQLLQRLYRLTVDLLVADYTLHSPFVMGMQKRALAARKDWTLTAIRGDLENFVSEKALLELEPQHKRAEREAQLYDNHQKLVNDLFDYTWTSPTWGESLGNAMIDLLLSPTIDSNDQQLMVSAMTLSLQNFFDFEKERVLMEVYRKTTDVRVRQRALVGWVLSLDHRCANIYPEMNTLLGQLLADETCRQEVKELQLQMTYCMAAEEDSRKAQQEMFSEIVKNNDQFRVTRNGIEEIEEDTLEDILHPEASEQRIEKVEAAVKKMMDMQRAGSDIYFAGFVQMKRFPFFNDTCNWFMPFYAKHPALRQTMSDKRHSIILLGMLRRSPFCDSDNYSFALGFTMALSHMPENMLEVLERGEMTVLGDQLGVESKEEPPYLRRAYLQDLFRFYRLFPSRSVFVSPFDPSSLRPFFMANPLFRATPLSKDFVDVAAFLAKHGEYQAAYNVLKNCKQEQYDDRYYLTNAAVMKHLSGIEDVDSKIKYCYNQVLPHSPFNEQALKGMGRIMFNETAYEDALGIYDRLLELHPDNLHYLLNKAICLGRLQQFEEALRILFKMNYEQPDNQIVSSTLAWTLVGAGKLEQAATMYEQLLQQSEINSNDLMNSGFCQWLMGNIEAAAELFKRYNARKKDLQAEMFIKEEITLLRRYGISDVEIQLMSDMVGA